MLYESYYLLRKPLLDPVTTEILAIASAGVPTSATRIEKALKLVKSGPRLHNIAVFKMADDALGGFCYSISGVEDLSESAGIIRDCQH